MNENSQCLFLSGCVAIEGKQCNYMSFECPVNRTRLQLCIANWMHSQLSRKQITQVMFVCSHSDIPSNTYLANNQYLYNYDSSWLKISAKDFVSFEKFRRVFGSALVWWSFAIAPWLHCIDFLVKTVVCKLFNCFRLTGYCRDDEFWACRY